MLICTAQLHNTSNAPTFCMSSQQIRRQVSPKLFADVRVDSWISQMIWQWIPDSWTGDRKCTGPKGATANLRNWQLMAHHTCWQQATLCRVSLVSVH